MKVAMICPQAPPVYGGAGVQALALASELVKRGCEVDLLTENQLLAPRLQIVGGVRILRAPGERLARRLPHRLARIVRTVVFTGWLVVRLLASYDLFHVHGVYWYALAPTAVARFRRLPLILKVTRLGDDDAETVSKKRFGPIPLGGVYAAPIRRASLVVALNAEIARRHRERFQEVPVVSLPNGVDVERFAEALNHRDAARAALAIPLDARVVLFVGFLSPRKGLAELLDAWDLAAERVGAPGSVLLLLVGPGDGVYGELSPTLSARAASLQAAAVGVRTLPQMPSDAMPAVYAAADVFVLPTKSEGMPNSVLEALAAGLPVIAPNVPGVREILEADPESLLLESGSAVAIAEALGTLLSRAAPGHARAPRVALPFRLDTVADAYVGLYDALSANDNQSRADAVQARLALLEHQW